MIYYFTPFDSEKNIGRSHNQHCEIVPNCEDWICITDSDVLFLLPDTKKQIEDGKYKTNDIYDLLCEKLDFDEPMESGDIEDIELFDEWIPSKLNSNELNSLGRAL